jgi:hypothetical protein
MVKKLFLALLFLGGLSRVSHAALAASDLISRARTLLKDTSSSANRQQFSDTQYLQWASDGQREANAQNWLLQSSYTFTLSGGTTEYAMPSDFMFPNRVWYQQSGQPFTKLPASSMNDLDARTPGWFNVSGTPIAYYVDMSTSTIYLGFYPAPISSSTGPVIVYYVQSSIDMFSSNESVQPFNSWVALQPYVSALPYYMAYRGYLVLEETDLAKEYLQYWVNFLLIMRQGINRQPDFNPPGAALRGGNPTGQGGLGGP